MSSLGNHCSDFEDFETLRAYDEAAYRRRCDMHGLEGLIDEGNSYRGSLLHCEAHLVIGGSRLKIFLSMAAGYIYSRLCDVSSTLVKALIPYRYVRGRHHGKMSGKYRCWDMRLHANGKEALVEKLERRIWTYERQRLDILLTYWDTETRPCVYIVEELDTPHRALHIVFSNKEALRHIRFRSFLADCHALEHATDALKEAIRYERALLTCHIQALHSELSGTYSANVTPLPERYRISVRPR